MSAKWHTIKIFLSYMVIAVMLPSFYMVAAETDEKDANIKTLSSQSYLLDDSVTNYSEYISGYKNKGDKATDIVLLDNKEMNFDKGMEQSFDITVYSDSLYELCVEYMSLTKTTCEFEFTIDNEYPFFEAQNINLPSYWCDNGEVRADKKGNQFAAEQKLSDVYCKESFRSYTGEFSEPYVFYFTSGIHKLNLKLTNGKCKIKNIVLKALKENQNYLDTVNLKEINKTNDIDEIEIIEGENASVKSSPALIALSDDGNSDVSPSHPYKTVINYIGGSNWSGQNDTIVWNFDVKKSGYYNIGFFYRQKDVVGGVSYRHLKIDGETPFKEAEDIKFKYSSYWEYMNFGGKEPYWIYLEEGSHTISLSVTSGELTDIYRQLKEVTSEMGDLYIDITMVVGETVDTGRSYELFNQIPEFNERLKKIYTSLEEIVEHLEKLQEKTSGSNVSNIKNAIATIKKMHDNPYSAHKYKVSFYNAYTNLSAMLGTITDMPLDIDRIFIIGKGFKLENPKANVFEKISFGAKRFIYSFITDYVSDIDDQEDALTLWVNWGRDQTQVLDALVQSDFLAKKGIPVNVKLVNASLIQAILAGDGPDVMLQMARTEPVNLAMRGALYDLSKFDDFEDVMTRFTKDAQVPYTYGNGVYALPDTMSFYLMFARTDVLSELDLEIPKTWEDFIYVMTVLQHKNLQVCFPYTQITDSGTVNTGVGGLTMYPTMLLQNGLELYNSEHTACTLTEEAQIGVFSDWVKFYTKYKLPKTMDFYNRFRIGSAPLGLAPYIFYTQLKAAAPEIEGRWSVFTIPGTLKEDGKVDYSSAGSGTGCAITKLSKQPEKAWEFLKWWTSAEVQTRYSDNLESVLGYLGRVATANVESLNSMVWDDETKTVLSNQLERVVQIPEIPGGYYTARGIDQAFWSVIEQNEVPTDALLKWAEIVNGEILRKRQEYIN